MIMNSSQRIDHVDPGKLKRGRRLNQISDGHGLLWFTILIGQKHKKKPPRDHFVERNGFVQVRPKLSYPREKPMVDYLSYWNILQIRMIHDLWGKK